jgi:hypothetical protein
MTASARDGFLCASCMVPIAHQPTFHVGLAFCCAGCAAGGPCLCSYDLEDPDDDQCSSSQPGWTSGGALTPGAADDEGRLVGVV